LKNKKQNSVAHESKIVLRILPNEFLITTTYLAERYQTKSTFIRWPLPKTVNPHNINADIELLSDHLARLAKAYQLEGNHISVILPHSIAPLKTIEIPLNLEVAADKKEYKNQTKQPYDFWKEFDDSLVDFKQAEIRANYLYSNQMDSNSKMLYSAISSKTIKDYVTMILSGNLYPVEFISEDQSIIKIVESRLTRVEKERPFCVFHLSKGNHKLIHCSHEEINVAKVDISDLDEILFDEITADTDFNNDFWQEIAQRLTSALKQAVLFLRDERKVSKFESVFFVSDYNHESQLFKLFNKNFRLANFRSLSSQFMCFNYPKGIAQNIFDKQDKNRYIDPHSILSSALMPNLGAYKLKSFSSPSLPNLIVNSELINLHPQASFIVNNFKYRTLFNRTLFFSLLFIVIFGGIDLFNNYLKISNSSLENEYQSAKDLVDPKLKHANESRQKIMLEKQKVDQFNELAFGNHNQYIIDVINHDLPQDLELERFDIREGDFQMYGNSRSVAEINRFYKKILANPNLKNTSINVYKRADSSLDFFEVSGKVQ